jgi:hypothetical protein
MCGYDLHIAAHDTEDGSSYHSEDRYGFEAEADAVAWHAEDLANRAFMSRPEFNPDYHYLPRTYPNGIEGVDEFAGAGEDDIRVTCVQYSA